jgi:hypothetical protein
VGVAKVLDGKDQIAIQSLLNLGSGVGGITTGPRIRWGAVDLVVTTPANMLRTPLFPVSQK